VPAGGVPALAGVAWPRTRGAARQRRPVTVVTGRLTPRPEGCTHDGGRGTGGDQPPE
jgi:hypothetical protein